MAMKKGSTTPTAYKGKNASTRGNVTTSYADFEKKDEASDKRMGIKENSKRDLAKDAKAMKRGK
jgi:hypothetical protein